MKKWPSIESFRKVYQNVHAKYVDYLQEELPTFVYSGTVKLHGCNASVVISRDGDQRCQSRKRVINAKDDVYGFATWVDSKDKLFYRIAGTLVEYFGLTEVYDVAMFGEWAGPGIQSGVAVNGLPHRIFVIFGFNNFDSTNQSVDEYYDVTQIPTDLVEQFNACGVYFINQCSFNPTVTIDFNKAAEVDQLLTDIATQVREKCPFSKELFNVEGRGEGVVWTKVEENDNHINQQYSFKTVIGDLSPSKKNTAAAISPETVRNINECVDIILTERRLQQGVEHLVEMGHPIDVSSTGHFLKWVSLDCMKEEMDTVEANELEWKMVVKELNKRARDWFLVHINPF